MKLHLSNGCRYYTFSLLDQYAGLKHAVFTRHGGVSKAPYDSLNVSFATEDDPDNVLENQARILNVFGTDKLISAHQTHSKNTYMFRSTDPFPEQELENYDAFVSNAAGILFMVKVADCQAVILFDSLKKVLGLAHSGWKGSIQNVIGETLRVMKNGFQCDPKNIYGGISPSLGPCCSEFTDPYNELPAAFHKYIRADRKVNFWQASYDQMIAEGVLREHIENAEICTADHTDEFFSHRKEKGATGRFAVTAMIT